MNWKPITILPDMKDDGTGYESSDLLLLWLQDIGPAFGFVARSNGRVVWSSNSYRGFDITHWAKIEGPDK